MCFFDAIKESKMLFNISVYLLIGMIEAGIILAAGFDSSKNQDILDLLFALCLGVILLWPLFSAFVIVYSIMQALKKISRAKEKRAEAEDA